MSEPSDATPEVVVGKSPHRLVLWLRSISLKVPFLVLVVAAIGWHNGIGALDSIVGDLALRHTTRPASSQIVIIAIDEPSLAQLGRWPWARSTHAQLLDRLRQVYQPAAIGLDLIFSEQDKQYAESDAQLERAIKEAGNVVLPVSMYTVAGKGPQAELPLHRFADAARALGHVHFEISPDGIVRSAFLQEGMGSSRWNHFVLAMMEAAGMPMDHRSLPGLRGYPSDSIRSAGVKVWSRDFWTQIPYAGPHGRFRTVSYIDVLEGRVPPDVLSGKLLLVGATAAGMGDAYPTVMSGQGAAMPGVEMMAHMLDGLLQGVHLDCAAPWANALFNLVPLLVGIVLLRELSSRYALLAVLVVAACVPLLAWGAQVADGIRFAPAIGILGLLTYYMLWSWQRQESALRYMSEEFIRIRQEHPTFIVESDQKSDGDTLSQRIRQLRSAAAQMRVLHLFLHTSLDSLPDAMLVTDANGIIALANAAAVKRLEIRMCEQQLNGQDVTEVLTMCLPPVAEVLPSLVAGGTQSEFMVETAFDKNCDLLIKGVPRIDGRGRFGGWILTLVDVRFVRQAQRRNEEALRFISHDIRAPQSSILTLIELRRNGMLAELDAHEVLERVEGLARRSLALADDFLHLARAEASAYRLEVVDLADVIIDAADQIWAQANASGVLLRTHLPDEPACCTIERALMTRAVVNLMSNAIKFSARGSQVDCRLYREGDRWCIKVKDQGVGIASEEIPLLFQKFRRLNSSGRAQPDGAGLGLTFVKAVMTQHNGTVGVTSALGVGSEFCMTLPLADPRETSGVADATSESRVLVGSSL